MKEQKNNPKYLQHPFTLFFFSVFLLLPTNILAQDIQIFNPTNSNTNQFLTTEGSKTLKKGSSLYDLNTNYSRDVLLVKGLETSENGGTSYLESPITNLTTLELLYTKGLLSFLDVMVAIPLGFSSGTKGLSPVFGPSLSASNDGSGLNNIRIYSKINLVDPDRFRGFGLSISIFQSLPVQNERREKITSFGFTVLRLILDQKIGNFSISFNFSYRHRFENIAKTEYKGYCNIANIQQEQCNDPLYRGAAFYYSVGMKYSLTDEIALILDGYGKYFYQNQKNGQLDNPVEILGAIRISTKDNTFTTIGAGTGLGNAVGTTFLRIIVNFGFKQEPAKDSDGDGKNDDKDLCMYEPEDFDKFEDMDGCPDSDNDKDGIEDFKDKCPLQAEDMDAFEDVDGCPDPDNDKDGLVDNKDSCPLQPEDPDGIDDFDGCPERDVVVETKPKTKKGRKINYEKDFFFDKTTQELLPKSDEAINNLMKILNEDQNILQISIEIHTDNSLPVDEAQTLTEKRAKCVADALINKGLDPKRVVYKGFGSSKPMAGNTNKNAEERAENRRIEIRISEYKQ